jgi:putative hemolysin
VKKLLIILFVVGAMTVTACGSTPAPEALPSVAVPSQAAPTVSPTEPPPAAAPTQPSAQETPTEDTTFESPLDMANPASAYCVEQGYQLEIRDEAGGQVGYCVFPNGAECEEWAFYRGECSVPETYP